MSRRFWSVLTLVVALFASFVAGCRACGSDKHVAEVKRHRGTLTRDTASTQQRWEPAEDGARLALGDGLRTGPSSEAIVRLTRGGTLKLPADTTIRFLAGAPGSAGGKLAVEAGEASIEADENGALIETTIGVAHIESGGTLRIAAGPGGATRVEVSIGAARIDTEDGGVALSPGKSFEVSLGGAILERDAPDAAVDVARTPDPALPTGPTDAGAATIAIDVKGKGARLSARGTKGWQVLPEGAGSVAAGDTLDVPLGASVEIRRGTSRGRLTGAGRYVVGDADGPLVTASGGKLEIESSGDEVAVAVPGGFIYVKQGGRVAVDVGPAGAKATALRGEGEVRGKTTEAIRAGESAVLTANGPVKTAERAPERADFTVPAGESLVIRDPRPPTALGVDFASVCPGGAVVARGEAIARGDKRGALYFPTGYHTYTVRCIGPDGVEDKPAATGNVTVIADAARADLPRIPPSTVVDMDGRRYTLLYQNLLPSVVARWQGAPTAGGYVLHLDKQTFKTDGPRHVLQAGSVAEGSHVLWFETGDGKKSPETTLVIKFDNAAPAASVREPVDGSFKPGDSVKVSGVVIEGYTVNVNGQAVPLDEHKRFSTTTTAAPGENAIVIRLTHPQRGTVHYVRHAAGAAR